jgi:hypothetical protein
MLLKLQSCPKANAHVRSEAQRLAFEADDITEARLRLDLEGGFSAAASSTPSAKAGLGASVNIERVKATGAINVLVGKLTDLEEQLENDLTQIMAQADELVTAGMAALTTAKTEVSDGCKVVLTEVLLTKLNLNKIIQHLMAYSTSEDIKRDKGIADNIMKAFNKGKYKDYKKNLAQFRKVLNGCDRTAKLATGAEANVNHVPSAPPIVVIANAIVEQGLVNLGTSLFEAKCGVRAALVAPIPGSDPMTEILRMPRTKRSLKDLSLHLRTNKSGNTIIADPPTLKRVVKELKKGFDASLFATLTLPSQDWSAGVYNPQYFGSATHFCHVGFLHMCCMEVRMLLTGEETIIGLPYERCPGNNLKEKRSGLFTTPMDSLRALIQSGGGFAIKHDTTKVAVLPTGYVYIITSTGATGLRWSCSSDESDTNRVKLCLTDLLKSFPETGNSSTGYTQWLQWLNSM